MTDVFVTDEGSMVVLRSAYDPSVVSTIKTARVRSYDPATKMWRVAADEMEELTEALAARGHFVHPDAPRAPVQSTAEFFGGRAAAPAPPTVEGFFAAPATDEFDANILAREILAPIPESQRGQVFRAMAKILHPDMFTPKQLR